MTKRSHSLLIISIVLAGCVSKPPPPDPIVVIKASPRPNPKPSKKSSSREVKAPAITPEKKVVRIELSKESAVEMRQVARPVALKGAPSSVALEKPASASRKEEEPREGVWFSATEITLGQYICYLEETGDERGIDWADADCPLKRGSNGYILSGSVYGQSLNQPMVEIDWVAAGRYCEWLTAKQKEDLLEGYAFRLPSREEWEIVAVIDCDASSVVEQAWIEGTSRGVTHRVGRRPAGTHGYHDFYGNVWEWSCSKTEKGAYKLNGGSWLTPLKYAMLYNSFFPDETQSTVGFRVILLKD